MRILLFFGMLVVFFYFAVSMFLPQEPAIIINNQRIKVEIADEPAEWQKGLSDKESLKAKEGMLFIFPEVDYRGFWMKDMRFPIDILWINEHREIIEITQSVSVPDAKDTPIFYSKKPIHYVLEVNAGFSETYNIKVGDTAEFQLDTSWF